MITTLTGENSFAWAKILREQVDKFVAEFGDLALQRIDGEEAEFASISEALSSLPFLSNKKLVVLRSPSKNKDFQERVEQVLADVGETTDVIIIEPKLDKRLSYYKFLKSKTDFKEFNEMDINGLSTWLSARAKQLGGSISPSDARYLAERVGLNQQMLGNEIEKLVLHNPAVTRQTVDLLTDETPQSTIFQLLESAFSGNSRKALKLYQEQRTLKVEPQQIVAMIAWQLHVLAIIKYAGDRSIDEVARDSKINPYVLRKSQAIADELSLAQLQALIEQLLAIDNKSKSTSIDIDEALKNYLLTLSTKAWVD